LDQNNHNREILDRILKAVEKDRGTRWVETVSTVLLSLAAVVTSWCIYEATQWSGEQYFRIEDVNLVDRQRMDMHMQANQKRLLHVNMFMNFAEAYTEENRQLADFLRDRFPPELKTAAIAWKATDPLNNPSAPRSPFEMKEYVLPEDLQAKKYAEQAEVFHQAASEADGNADNYVLMTIFLAVVLFLSGLAGVIDSYLQQKILLSLATGIFLVTIVSLLRLPVLL